MTTQILTIGNRRFVLIPEKNFQRLEKRAGEAAIRPEFAKDAMRELNTYRKTRKAVAWPDVKRRLGL